MRCLILRRPGYRERGLETLRGPVSFSVNHEVGLLLDAFDEPPLIRMTYNPPYYAGLIEGYGLRKIQDLYAYVMFENEEIPARLRAISDRVLEDPKLVVRTVNVRDFENEMARIKKIYAEAWSENWGAVPLTEDEFDRIVGEFRLIYDRDLFFIAEYDGEPAGYVAGASRYEPGPEEGRRPAVPPGFAEDALASGGRSTPGACPSWGSGKNTA